MYGRGFDPNERGDAVYALASVLISAWLLVIAGVFAVGSAVDIILAAATVAVAAAAYRRRV